MAELGPADEEVAEYLFKAAGYTDPEYYEKLLEAFVISENTFEYPETRVLEAYTTILKWAAISSRIKKLEKDGFYEKYMDATVKALGAALILRQHLNKMEGLVQ